MSRQMKTCFIYKKKSVHCVYIKIYKTKIENIKMLKCVQTLLKCDSWKTSSLNQFEEYTFHFKNYHTKKFPKLLKKFTGFHGKNFISMFIQGKTGCVVPEMLGVNATKAVNLLETYLLRRIFSTEPITVSFPNLVKAMSCKLLIDVQSERKASDQDTIFRQWFYLQSAFEIFLPYFLMEAEWVKYECMGRLFFLTEERITSAFFS